MVILNRWKKILMVGISKNNLHSDHGRIFCHPREIWWCALGVNIGSEQDGTGKNFNRPIIVIRGFNKNIFFGAALTGRKKQGKFYFPIGLIERQRTSVILSQIRIIDTKRLIRKNGNYG